jgi:hypothetical protein
MTFDEVMREFAELIGRVLAQRWLDSQDREKRTEPTPDRSRRNPGGPDPFADRRSGPEAGES